MIGFFDAMQPATTIVALVRKRINVSQSDNPAFHTAMLSFDDNSYHRSGSRRAGLR
jgi:hypothetical protein